MEPQGRKITQGQSPKRLPAPGWDPGGSASGVKLFVLANWDHCSWEHNTSTYADRELPRGWPQDGNARGVVGRSKVSSVNSLTHVRAYQIPCVYRYAARAPVEIANRMKWVIRSQ